MKTDILTNGSTVRNRISLKTVCEYNVIRRSSLRSWCQACQQVLPQVLILQHQWHLQDSKVIILHPSSSSSTFSTTTVLSDSETRTREDLSGIDSHPVPVSSSHGERIERGDPLLPKPTKNPKANKNENHDIERGDPLCSDILEWLQDFTEKSRGWQSSWTQRFTDEFFSWTVFSAHAYEKCRLWLNTVFIYTHLPKNRHCEICQRTKITRAPCRKRIGGAVPRAEKFGDLITADHIVLSENCKSRNNHRCAIVVQDLATQWIQSYPCKTKTSSGNSKGACKSSWSHIGSLKNHFPVDTHTDRKHLWLPRERESAVRRVKEGTSAVLLQSGLDEHWWADSMECYTYLRNIQDLLSDGKHQYERRFGEPFKGPIITFGSLVESYPISAKDQSRIHQFGKKVLLRLFLWIPSVRGEEFGRVTYWLPTLRSWKRWTHLNSTQKRLNAKEVIFPKENGNFIFPVTDGRIKPSWRRSGTENIHLDTGTSNSRRKSHRFSWRIRRVSSTTSWPREAIHDFWSMSGNFIHRQLYSPREESFPIPVKYINVSRTTHEFGCQARATHRCLNGNIVEARDLSDYWTGFTQFTLLNEKPPGGYVWSEERREDH